MAKKYEVFTEKRRYTHKVSVEKGATFKIITNGDSTFIRTLSVDKEPEDVPENWKVIELVAAVHHEATLEANTKVNVVLDGAGNQYLQLPVKTL